MVTEMVFISIVGATITWAADMFMGIEASEGVSPVLFSIHKLLWFLYGMIMGIVGMWLKLSKKEG